MKVIDLYDVLKHAIDANRLANADFSRIGVFVVHRFNDMSIDIYSNIVEPETDVELPVAYVPEDVAKDPEWKCVLHVSSINVVGFKLIVDAAFDLPYNKSCSLEQLLEKMKDVGPNAEVQINLHSGDEAYASTSDVEYAEIDNDATWTRYLIKHNHGRFDAMVGLVVGYDGEFATNDDAIGQFEEEYGRELSKIAHRNAMIS